MYIEDYKYVVYIYVLVINLPKTNSVKEYPTKKMLRNMDNFSIAAKMSSDATRNYRGMKRSVERIKFIKGWMKLEKEPDSKSKK